jgi:hypothetical protein
MIQLALTSIFIVAVGSAQSSTKSGTKHMMRNQNNLHEVQSHLEHFETSQDPDWLVKAQETLGEVLLTEERDPKVRKEIRLHMLDMWLRLLDSLDRHFDPAFDENDTPQKLVQPPALPDPKQGSLRPGASPSLIADPKLRAEYEHAIAANRAKTKRYRLQLLLRRMGGSLRQEVHGFIASAYKPTPEDRDEVRKAIERNIASDMEKATLLKLPIFGRSAAVPQ